MIAVISSTIKPPVNEQKVVSLYSFEERLEQTRHTVERLHECGFDQIFLVDNSPQLDQLELQKLLKDFPGIKAYHLQQYQFINKGVNELLMLLYVTEKLPRDEMIFKISARYYPSDNFVKPRFEDFAVKPQRYNSKNGVISTRAYWVRNATIFEYFLLNCLDELFAYPERIVGIKSIFRLLFVKKNIIDEPLNISIEFAAANVLKASNYQVKLLETIGIEGLIAGAKSSEKVIE